jgi:hypothetical protein
MSTKQLTAMAIRFLALWFLVQVVLLAPWLLDSLSRIASELNPETDKYTYFALSWSFFFIGTVIAIVLFRVSNSILATGAEEEVATESGATQNFLLQLLGIYFIVNALEAVPTFIGVFFIQSREELSEYLYISGEVLALVIGVYLLVRPTGLRIWLNRLGGVE